MPNNPINSDSKKRRSSFIVALLLLPAMDSDIPGVLTDLARIPVS